MVGKIIFQFRGLNINFQALEKMSDDEFKKMIGLILLGDEVSVWENGDYSGLRVSEYET